MSFRSSLAVKTLMASLLMCALAVAQSDASGQTMRPVIRGRHAAIASMKAEATEAARQILAMGGNAFDAAVGGQAALGVTDFSLNGVGSDAVILVYNAHDKKVYSINAEPRAPKLASIEWYEKNNGGKIPESDGLLAGGLPGVVDAWYTLLDRWGTMSFTSGMSNSPIVDPLFSFFIAAQRFPRPLIPSDPARPTTDKAGSPLLERFCPHPRWSVPLLTT